MPAELWKYYIGGDERRDSAKLEIGQLLKLSFAESQLIH